MPWEQPKEIAKRPKKKKKKWGFQARKERKEFTDNVHVPAGPM